METLTEITQICTICHVEKPLSAFFRDAKGLHGHRRQCSKCFYERMQRRRRAKSNNNGATHDLSNKDIYPCLHRYVTDPDLFNIYAKCKVTPGDTVKYQGKKYKILNVLPERQAKSKLASFNCEKAVFYEQVKVKEIK